MKTNLLIKLSKALLKLAEIATDKGTLIYDGELSVGTEVFVEEDGEYVHPADGEYAAEDKKLEIKEGIITSIEEIEPSEDEEPQEEPAEMSAKDKFVTKKEQFEASYQDIEYNILSALYDAGVDAYLIENSSNYAVVSVWSDEDMSEHLYRYDISISEDGYVTLGDRVAVRVEYVPVNQETADDDEMAQKDAEIAELQSKLAEAENKLAESVGMSAKNQFNEKIKQEKNGIKLRSFK